MDNKHGRKKSINSLSSCILHSFFMLFVGKMWDEYEFVGYVHVEYCPSTFVLFPWQPQHGEYVRICAGAVTAWAKEPAARSLADTFLFILPLKF